MPLLGAAQTLPPDAILPFNESGWSPGFVPGGAENLPEGPAAIAATRHAVFIADNVRDQLLILDRTGAPIGALPLSIPVADLQVDPSGRITLLSADHAHLLNLASDGSVLTDLSLPPSTVRGLATTPEGDVWTVHVSGQGSPAGTLPTGEHAAPLGRHGSLHGAGVLRDPRAGDVLLWNWNQPATLKGQGPTRVLSVETTRRLGLIRPIHMDRHGAVYILLETLSEHAPLEVTLEIRRIQPNGRASRVAWDVHPHAPSSASVAIDEEGTVYRYESRPEGMFFWRVDAHEWMEVQR